MATSETNLNFLGRVNAFLERIHFWRIAELLLITVVVTGVCATLGFVLGVWLYSAQYSGKFNQWESALLPEGHLAKQFVTGYADEYPEFTSAYVLAQDNKLFVKRLSSSISWNTGWEEADQVDESDYQGFPERCTLVSDQSKDRRLDELPGSVIGQLDCEAAGEWGGASYRFAILENGEVWQWEVERTIALLGLMILYPVGLGIVGGLLGLIVLVIIGLVRIRRQAQVEE